MTASRKRSEETLGFLVGYLRSHPGSTGSEILVRAEQQGFSRAAVYRHLHGLIANDLVRKARGRYWLGRIEDAELAIESEVERTFAILRSSQLSNAAKLEAARQLARESGHASPRSGEVVEVLRFVAGAPKEIRIAILPFVFRTMQAAVRIETTDTKPRQAPQGKAKDWAGAGYSRRLWEVVRVLIAPFSAPRMVRALWLGTRLTKPSTRQVSSRTQKFWSSPTSLWTSKRVSLSLGRARLAPCCAEPPKRRGCGIRFVSTFSDDLKP